MAQQLLKLIQHTLATLDKVNEQVLSVANAEVFSANAEATRAKLNVVVGVTLPSVIRKATVAVDALKKAISKHEEPRFLRATAAMGTLKGDLFPAVKRNIGHYFQGKVGRVQLVVLSKKFTQATITIRRILEGLTE